MAARAHNIKDLEPLFICAANKLNSSSLPNPRPGASKSFSGDSQLLFVHLPFHMQQPLQADLRPHTTKLLETLKSEQDCFKRIIIAFSKAPNISDFCKKNRLEAQIDTRQKR